MRDRVGPPRALVAAGAGYWLLLQRVLADREDTHDDFGIPANGFRYAVATRIAAWFLPGETP